jgi:CxxC motif-containing protein (DUF1111 family)
MDRFSTVIVHIFSGRMSCPYPVPAVLVILTALAFTCQAQNPVDPGPRPGPAGAGTFVRGLTTDQVAFSTVVRRFFIEINPVTFPQQGANVAGLGARFDSNSCNSCHAQPAVGGSSPAVNQLFNIFQLDGAQNTMPSFELPNGPTLVARFPFQPDLVTPDGFVHQLFVITGRTDLNGAPCFITQPDFATAQATNNIVFRNTTPTFGGGMVEIIEDSDILANMNSNLSQKQALGISGHPNIADDGTISRFGHKAQERSLTLFSGGAYNIEEGVSNELFPNKTDETPGCTPPYPNQQGNFIQGVPDDRTHFSTPNQSHPGLMGDPDKFGLFMRLLSPPRPSPSTPSTLNGQQQFNNVGCLLCHTTSFVTPQSSIAALGNQQVNLFSDLLVHHMGPCLADNIIQGLAQGDEWRTAPLWGVGKRIFFLHDGRTSDIVQAVQDHFCLGNLQYPDSEANAVVNSFNALSPTDQQDIINFLRSL